MGGKRKEKEEEVKKGIESEREWILNENVSQCGKIKDLQ